MMRCLRDMNMSKFVAEDVPLFLSLIDDLFPGLKADRASFPEISAALEKVGPSLHLPPATPARRMLCSSMQRWLPCCAADAHEAALQSPSCCLLKCWHALQVTLERGLQLHPSWLNKCIQLYETYLVRHGIMLVGPAGSGKSAICECLAAALTELGTKHVIWRMNPKAITAPQMFGRMDAATGAICLTADDHTARFMKSRTLASR